MTDKAKIWNRIESQILRAADEAFDPEEAEDSDGYDQGQRAGLLQALDIVNRVMRNA